MDFVVGLPKTTKGYDAIWVVVDIITKSAHFIPICSTYSMERFAEIYTQEIVRLHGVPLKIVSDRDSRFLSIFWQRLQKALGTHLAFSTAYHPQSDGQSERTVQTLEDMLRACVLDFKDHWSKYRPLIEFSYNNSYHASIEMAPYEALYGRKCRSHVHWDEIGERRLLGPEMIREMTEAVSKNKRKN